MEKQKKIVNLTEGILFIITGNKTVACIRNTEHCFQVSSVLTFSKGFLNEAFTFEEKPSIGETIIKNMMKEKIKITSSHRLNYCDNLFLHNGNKRICN